MEIRTTSDICAAITKGQFTEANHLLADLRLEVEKAWALSESEQDRMALAEHVSSALEWARGVVTATRAHDHDTLARIARARQYTPHYRPADILDFDA